jgi:hypothetical protein
MTWLILDSGAGGVSLIAKDQAQVFGLDNAKDQHLKVDLAPGIIVDSPALVTNMIMDGNQRQSFLSKHVITLDLSEARAWIAPPWE